jgi:hypothetical protein
VVDLIHKLNSDLSQHCPTPTTKYALAKAPLLKTVNIDMATIQAWAVLDSGATSRFLATAAPMTNMYPTNKSIVAPSQTLLWIALNLIVRI